jgi:chemotaxis regulatin CheY-phosphate phosphatase CheZ
VIAGGGVTIKLIVTIRGVWWHRFPVRGTIPREFHDNEVSIETAMSSAPTPPISEADYDAIEAAVVETVRGRWFLAEYARRNRTADTTMLLAALDRIEASIRGEGSVQAVDRIRFDLVEMAKAISRTKSEIAAIKPDADHHGKFGEASEELDSIVQATETATSNILAAAEQVQEIAWTLREQGFEAEVCDLLDSKATDVYTACSFQDITGQRTRKVITVLRYLESRINAMIGIWGLNGAMAAEAAETARERAHDALLNGPALPGQGFDQTDVDVVIGPTEPAAPAQTVEPEPLPERSEPAPEPVTAGASASDDFYPPVTTTLAFDEPEPESPPLQPATEARLPPQMAEPHAPAVAADASVTPAPMPQHDPLAAVTALSYEEKIALFT